MAYDKGSASPLSDEDIKARLAEDEDFLTALQSGNIHIGHPSEGPTEAKIADLRRQIAIWQSLLVKRRASRAGRSRATCVFIKIAIGMLVSHLPACDFRRRCFALWRGLRFNLFGGDFIWTWHVHV